VPDVSRGDDEDQAGIEWAVVERTADELAQGPATEPRHVLVVEDDPDLRFLLRTVLTDVGFEVEETDSGPSALEALERRHVDLVLLDLGLPGLDGHEVLRQLRVGSDVPVIVLSGRQSETERTAVLESGADDYVSKPFSTSEMLARMRAVLRRARPPAAVTSLSWGRLRIDLLARGVEVVGRPVPLTPIEYELLRHLATHPGVAVSREQFLREVWHSRSAWQDPETVTEHVRRLRVKLAAAGLEEDWITTLRGFGYRFDPPRAGPAPGAVAP
jgi:two-component system, OmpR family, phosphate regulon response regulator PhoB